MFGVFLVIFSVMNFVLEISPAPVNVIWLKRPFIWAMGLWLCSLMSKAGCWTLLHSASIFIQTQLTFHCHCNIVAPAAAHWSFRHHLVGPVIFSLETNDNSSNSNYNKQICMAPWGRKFFGGFCPCCSVWVLCRRFQFQFADTFSFVLTLCFQMLLWRSVCVRLSLCLDGFGCILRRTSYSPSLNGCETAFKWTDYYSVVFRFCYGIFHTVLDQTKGFEVKVGMPYTGLDWQMVNNTLLLF